MSYLLKGYRRDAVRREAPLAVGQYHSLFVDGAGCMHSCGHDMGGEPPLFGHVRVNADPDISREIGLPTVVPSMPEPRIVSVASSTDHCLALCAEGDVYSWGDGDYGTLGHGDMVTRAVPSRIE